MTPSFLDLSSLDTTLPHVHSDNAVKSRALRTRPERVGIALVAEKTGSPDACAEAASVGSAVAWIMGAAATASAVWPADAFVIEVDVGLTSGWLSQ